MGDGEGLPHGRDGVLEASGELLDAGERDVLLQLWRFVAREVTLDREAMYELYDRPLAHFLRTEGAVGINGFDQGVIDIGQLVASARCRNPGNRMTESMRFSGA